jgi:predicted phosphodiesterase
MRSGFLAGLLLAGASVSACTAAGASASPVHSPERAVPPGGSAWSFAILGDNRDDPDSVFPAIVERIHTDGDVVFVIHLGDMVRSGGESQLKAFLKLSAPIRECFFPVVGNHEIRHDRDRHDFKAAFGLKSTSYSFTYRNAHIAVIDNASQEFTDSVLRWLRADLDTYRKGIGGIERVFVAMHIPPSGLGVSTHVAGDKAQQFDGGSRSLMELLHAYSVDAIFAGHIHRAQVANVPGGPRLVVSGAAGAPQYLRLRPHYGYHRVTVNGAETRVEFVEVSKGQNAPVERARSHQATCPKIDDAEGG